jgi:hypothetical protein
MTNSRKREKFWSTRLVVEAMLVDIGKDEKEFAWWQ